MISSRPGSAPMRRSASRGRLQTTLTQNSETDASVPRPKDFEALSHDMLQLKRQHANVLQENSFLKAQLQRLASQLKKKDRQLEQVLSIPGLGSSGSSSNIAAVSGGGTGDLGSARASLANSPSSSSLFNKSASSSTSPRRNMSKSKSASTLHALGLVQGASKSKSTSALPLSEQSAATVAAGDVQLIDSRLRKLRSELTSISALSEKLRQTEAELSAKDQYIRALKASTKYALVRELQVEAQTYYGEAQRLKRVIDARRQPPPHVSRAQLLAAVGPTSVFSPFAQPGLANIIASMTSNTETREASHNSRSSESVASKDKEQGNYSTPSKAQLPSEPLHQNADALHPQPNSIPASGSTQGSSRKATQPSLSTIPVEEMDPDLEEAWFRLKRQAESLRQANVVLEEEVAKLREDKRALLDDIGGRRNLERALRLELREAIDSVRELEEERVELELEAEKARQEGENNAKRLDALRGQMREWQTLIQDAAEEENSPKRKSAPGSSSVKFSLPSNNIHDSPPQQSTRRKLSQVSQPQIQQAVLLEAGGSFPYPTAGSIAAPPKRHTISRPRTLSKQEVEDDLSKESPKQLNQKTSPSQRRPVSASNSRPSSGTYVLHKPVNADSKSVQKGAKDSQKTDRPTTKGFSYLEPLILNSEAESDNSFIEGRSSSDLDTKQKSRTDVESEAVSDPETNAQLRMRAELGERAKAIADAKIHEAKVKAKAEAEARARAEVEAKARAEAEAKARAEAEAKARAEAEAKARAKAEADVKAKAEAEAKAKAEAEAKAKAEAEAKAKAEVEAKARAETEAKARADAETKARAKADAEAKAREEAEVKVRAEAEARARAEAEAEAKARADVEAKAKAEVEAKARIEAEAKLAEGRESDNIGSQQKAPDALIDDNELSMELDYSYEASFADHGNDSQHQDYRTSITQPARPTQQSAGSAMNQVQVPAASHAEHLGQEVKFEIDEDLDLELDE